LNVEKEADVFILDGIFGASSLIISTRIMVAILAAEDTTFLKLRTYLAVHWPLDLQPGWSCISSSKRKGTGERFGRRLRFSLFDFFKRRFELIEASSSSALLAPRMQAAS
jgi:hypothetical protein